MGCGLDEIMLIFNILTVHNGDTQACGATAAPFGTLKIICV